LEIDGTWRAEAGYWRCKERSESVFLDLDGKWKTTFPFDDTPLP
jgi:hypothetical protein